MANGHGGPRTPAKPAPVSGPGKLSRRTDGGPGAKLSAPTGMDYGAHKALMQQERTSAMAGPSPAMHVDAAPPQSPAPAGSPGTPDFGAASARPDEPITHGVDIGPGAGPEALGTAPANAPDGYLSGLLEQASTTDTTGLLGQLYLMAEQRGV